jgi:hypothetical protein
MSKRSKHSADFSIESLRGEVDEEINQQQFSASLLTQIRSIDLSLVDCIPKEILLCTLIIRYGLTVVCAIAHVVSSLSVLPLNVRAEVLKLLQPQLTRDDAETLFKCAKILDMKYLTSSKTDQVHVFAPPVGTCFNCDSILVRYNDPLKVKYHHHYGTSKGFKVSLKCNRCKTFYGYSKYGNPESGWTLYPERRPTVEATDVCFVERSLLKWQISLA